MALTKAHNRMIFNAALNAKDFGAVGDGVADDTAAIQAWFYALRDNASTVGYGVADGKFRITDTIDVTGLSGGDIFFTGGGPDRSLPNVGDLGTVFIWNGNNTDPMFDFTGVELVTFHGFAARSTTLDKADLSAIIRLNPSGLGIPTGAITFNGFYGSGAGDIIRAGTNSTDANCADINFMGITVFDRCDNGLKVNTVQGLNYTFEFVIAGRCENIFNLDNGGNLVARMVTTSFAHNVLTLGRGGPNVGVARIENYRLERAPAEFNAGDTDAPRIVNVPDSSGTYTTNFIVDIDGGTTEERTNWTSYHNILNNGVQVNFRGARLQPDFASIGSNAGLIKKSSLMVDGCLFQENSPKIEDYITCDVLSDFLVKNSKSLTGADVSSDYVSGINSFSKTLATDGVWVDVFEVSLAGASSVGVIVDMHTTVFLQGGGLRTVTRADALHRSSGTLSVQPIEAMVKVPSSANEIEMQAVVDGTVFKIQARRVGGLSTTATFQMGVRRTSLPQGAYTVKRL